LKYWLLVTSASKVKYLLATILLTLVLSGYAQVAATQFIVSSTYLLGTTSEGEALGGPGTIRQLFYAAGLDWAFYIQALEPNGTADTGYRCSSDNGVTWTPFIQVTGAQIGTSHGPVIPDVNGLTIDVVVLDINGSLLYRRGTLTPGVCNITWLTAFQTVYSSSSAGQVIFQALRLDSTNHPWVTYTTATPNSSYVNYRYGYVTTSQFNNGTWSTRAGFPYQLNTLPLGTKTAWPFPIPYQNGDMRIFMSGTFLPNWAFYWSATKQTFTQETITPMLNLISEVRTALVTPNGTTYYAFGGNGTAYPLVLAWYNNGVWSWKTVTGIGPDTRIELMQDSSGNIYVYYADYPVNNTLYLQQVVSNGIVNIQPSQALVYDPQLNHASGVYGITAIQNFQGNVSLFEYSHTVGANNFELLDFTVTLTTTPTTSTTSLASITSTTATTSLASTISTPSTLQTAVTSTTTTSTESPVNTNTLTTTTTTTGSVAGMSTTTFTSPLSTSFTTVSTMTDSSESVTETGATTTGTVQSETTTSTGTLLSTTTSAGTVTVSETDTFNVLLTQLYQELEQFEAFILQTLGFQVTATPMGQQVNQVVVTLKPTTTTVSSTQILTQTTTFLTTSGTTASTTTKASPVTVTSTQSPVITGTLSTTVTTTGSPTGTFTATSTQILTTSTSTSQTTLSTYTTTLQTVLKTSTTSATVTSSSTTFFTTTSSGTVKVTQTDIFTTIVSRIVQLLHQLVSIIMKILHDNATIVKTPEGHIVHYVKIVK
jgi:hypothetical protein